MASIKRNQLAEQKKTKLEAESLAALELILGETDEAILAHFGRVTEQEVVLSIQQLPDAQEFLGLLHEDHLTVRILQDGSIIPEF